MTDIERKLTADNEELKKKLVNIEARLSLMRSQHIMRKLYRARRDQDIREKLYAISTALESALPR